jgi:hypothetical protein
MFPANYFAPRYFAPRYFPKVGDDPAPGSSATYAANWLSPGLGLGCIMLGILIIWH